MEKPFVTVGLPCYNVEKFISWAVKSVLAQSYTNFELIITDDGSVDRTLDILRGIRDERIILVADGENHGISYRLNQQISMAKGDIFIRMDGDDIMFPDRIEKQVNYLMEHPNVDVIGASAIIIDDSNQIIGQRLSKDILPTKPEEVINNNPFIHPTIAGRIAFFKKYHYDEELNGVEDKDLWCRGVVFSCYQNIKAPLLFYRDPLQFKISTYIYRKKQGRKQVVKRWSLFCNKWPAIVYVVKSYFVILCIFVFHVIRMDDRLIGRRNTSVIIDKSYVDILKKVVRV